MKFLTPNAAASFIDFIDTGFIIKSNNQKSSIAPILIALNKISNFYDIKAKEALGEDVSNLDSSIIVHNTGLVEQIIENRSYGNLYNGKILAIYVPLEGSTFLIDFSIRDKLKVNIDYYPEYILLHCGVPTYGLYNIFYRLSGKESGMPFLIYIENRFNIYNKSMRKLEYDDIALDMRVVYSYLSSTFDSMMNELANEYNLFYIKKLDKISM